MITPQNDYIVVEPVPSEESSTRVILPDSARSLYEAVVVDLGQDSFVMTTFEKGNGGITMLKSELFPNVKIGSRVLYRKMAEERTTADAAYRVQDESGRHVLVIKITDIVAVK